MADHPLLRRMYPDRFPEEASRQPTTVQPNQQHPLVRKSPWVRNAEHNELPAKDTTNA